MDALDRDILVALQHDGRQTNARLAERLNLSPSAMLERVRRLERDRAIRGYRADVAPRALGVGLQAFVAAELEAHNRDNIAAFERGILRVPAVRTCYHITGRFDYLVHVAMQDLEHLGRLIKTDIADIPGVARFETLLVLSEVKTDTGWPGVSRQRLMPVGAVVVLSRPQGPAAGWTNSRPRALPRPEEGEQMTATTSPAARATLRNRLRIRAADLETVNTVLCDAQNGLIDDLLDLVDKYGGVAAINRAADDAGRLENRLARLAADDSPHLADLDWLARQRDAGAFVGIAEYRRDVLAAANSTSFNEANAVTLEISALQYFPWLIAEAERAIARRELMPARYIRVRNMAEQSAPGGDIIAVATAMQIIGATHVETLDTRGSDGSNVHLGGPDTLTGDFGGIGQPNGYPLRWADEYLHYLTEYGIREVLNVNSGTILVALLLHKLGVRNEFKVSVFMGVDNPWSALWLLMGARLLAGDEGSTSMAGLNLANSVEVDTLIACADVRKALGLEDALRFEHHVTEAYKSIVRQPYDRRADVVQAAATVPNVSAKHEGGDPASEAAGDHPSDILDYFMPLEEVERRGLMPALAANYLAKHVAWSARRQPSRRRGSP